MQVRNLTIAKGWSQLDLALAKQGKEGDLEEALTKYVEDIDAKLADVINWIESLTVPEYTTTERDALSSPQNGQMIYNSTTTRFEIRQAGGWKYLTVSSV